MPNHLYSRTRATLVHFILALIVFLPFWWLVQRWYPDDLLALQGGDTVMGWIALVHLLIAPLLTFVMFRPGKRSLVFDLAVIVFLQAAALSYGANILASQKPAFLVFLHDRFFVVTEGELLHPPSEAVENLPAWKHGPRPVLVRLSFQASLEADRTVATATEAPMMALMPSAFSEWQQATPRLRQLAAIQGEQTELSVPVVGRGKVGTALIDLSDFQVLSITDQGPASR